MSVDGGSGGSNDSQSDQSTECPAGQYRGIFVGMYLKQPSHVTLRFLILPTPKMPIYQIETTVELSNQSDSEWFQILADWWVEGDVVNLLVDLPPECINEALGGSEVAVTVVRTPLNKAMVVRIVDANLSNQTAPQPIPIFPRSTQPTKGPAGTANYLSRQRFDLSAAIN